VPTELLIVITTILRQTHGPYHKSTRIIQKVVSHSQGCGVGGKTSDLSKLSGSLV